MYIQRFRVFSSLAASFGTPEPGYRESTACIGLGSPGMRFRGSMMGAAATIEETDKIVTIDVNFMLASI
jgi:hypothetical protein